MSILILPNFNNSPEVQLWEFGTKLDCGWDLPSSHPKWKAGANTGRYPVCQYKDSVFSLFSFYKILSIYLHMQ